MRVPVCLALFFFAVAAMPARPAELRLVAAENFYGDVAAQIGGPGLGVTSILSNPDQDPHEFEANAGTARALAGAAILVYNGAGYDVWAEKLLAAAAPGRHAIEVARLLGRKPGDNPHIWYDPAAMPALAEELARLLTGLDPPGGAGYASRLARFRGTMRRLDARVAELRGRYRGAEIAATEPVFGEMAKALGLRVREEAFQLAVMNDSEPGAAAIARFEADLRGKAVRLLVFNRQTQSTIARRMRGIAREAGVPVLDVTEMLPPGEHYQGWMLSQLAALDRLLGAH